MAFNWQTFRTRTASALVFVALMAAGLFWNELSFLLLFVIVHFGCWIEYYRLVKKIKATDEQSSPNFFFLFMLLGTGILLWATGNRFLIWDTSLGDGGKGMLRTVLLLILFNGLYFRKKLSTYLLLALPAGLLYISVSIALLVQLRLKENNIHSTYALAIPLLIIFTNWINDTMAYIVGSFVGKTPLSSISPKKTWEGTIGGALLSITGISLIAYSTGWLPVPHAAALAAIGVIAGTCGDLFESKLKRLAGVKDSGTMMPGHGGFLDRFDSLLFAATACAIYVALALK